MAKPTQALPYIQRVVEDEFVQEQLLSALSGARGAYLRARKQRGQAVEDKGLYRNLRQVATALQNATNALGPRKPEPKHRGRKVATVALAIGATALITLKLQKQYARQRDDTGLAASSNDVGVGPSGAERRPEPAPAAAASTS